jgi:6-phosphogluconolactonase (cycloisomerase 2 family)
LIGILANMHPSALPAAAIAQRSAMYASVGAELTQYDVDVDKAMLTPRAAVTLPGYVQEAWPHPSKPLLYVAWSTGGPSYSAVPGASGPAGSRHGITTFTVDQTTGTLKPLGAPASLSARPIYITCDITGTHVVAAYNDPSGISVHAIAADGTIGSEIVQPDRLDVGIYAHQVRVSPSNAAVILVTRGNEPARGKPEDPGAVKVFRYRDGTLANLASIAPGGGIGFRSRHIDFHPTRPWVFLTIEAQNKLAVFRRADDDAMSAAPLFVKDTLVAWPKTGAGQTTSSIHVHPNGRFVYLGNRASGTVDVDGRAVFAGGENSIAVFSINEQTGEPNRIQNADTHGIHPRTFAIDPTGRLLVVGNQMSMPVREGGTIVTRAANLAVFRVGGDGRLTFSRTYDVNAGAKPLFWVGIVPLGTK